MLVTADQLVAHAIGDYIIQSDWMVQKKTKQHTAAMVHAVTYTLPFLALTQNLIALAVICVTHFAIDRWRLARFVVWAKNYPWPGSLSWSECSATGSPPDCPPYLAVWLMIITDNIMHVLCNAAAIATFI
jgi:Protein of unknown function (DUF3307)